MKKEVSNAYFDMLCTALAEARSLDPLLTCILVLGLLWVLTKYLIDVLGSSSTFRKRCTINILTLDRFFLTVDEELFI